MNQLNATAIKWILGTLALILVLHIPNLPIWVVVISASFGLWRYFILRNVFSMPKLYVLAPITLLIGIGILITFGGQLGRETSIAMLIAMLSLKLLEVKTKRDYYLVVMLGYFATGNLFLFNQSISTFVLSIAPLVLLTAALIQINFKHQPHLLYLLKLSGKLLLQAVPLMLVFFVLFPRIPGPLWSMPQNAHGGTGVTGLSDSIKFNQVSQLAQDGSVAFRVQFKGAIPPKNQLYWRGPVLWITSNNNWEVSNQGSNIAQEKLITAGNPIEYSITIEPNEQKWLLMLDMPTKIPAFASMTHDYSAVTKEPIVERMRYDVTSYPTYSLSANLLSKRELNLALQLNSGENPQTMALGKQWQHLNPADIVITALKRFKEDQFFYTLNPPILGENPIDEFLFKSKRGFCEHYAVSFVTLMRAAGVPARVVTGYQGGELNPNNHYLIVRQSDAHAWAEVWLQGRGWLRVDPTAQVAPERVELGVLDAIEAASQRFKPSAGQPRFQANLPFTVRSKQYPLFHQLLLKWDSLDNGWNQWVIGYNQSKQQSLLSQISGQKVNAQTLLSWLMFSLALLGVFTLLMIYRKNQANLSPAQKLYAQFLAKLRKFDLQPQLHEGALDFANRAAVKLPHLQHQLINIAQAYNALQYSQQDTLNYNSLLIDLNKLIQQFNPRA